MAQSTTITLTSSWVKIISDGEDFVFQNIYAANDVYIIYMSSGAPPSPTDAGHIIPRNGGFSSYTWVMGDVYIRGTEGDIVILTK